MKYLSGLHGRCLNFAWIVKVKSACQSVLRQKSTKTSTMRTATTTTAKTNQSLSATDFSVTLAKILMCIRLEQKDGKKKIARKRDNGQNGHLPSSLGIPVDVSFVFKWSHVRLEQTISINTKKTERHNTSTEEKKSQPIWIRNWQTSYRRRRASCPLKPVKSFALRPIRFIWMLMVFFLVRFENRMDRLLLVLTSCNSLLFAVRPSKCNWMLILFC